MIKMNARGELFIVVFKREGICNSNRLSDDDDQWRAGRLGSAGIAPLDACECLTSLTMITNLRQSLFFIPKKLEFKVTK